MNKKLIVIGISVAFILLIIPTINAISYETTKDKESPLFKIRSNSAVGEKIENFKTKYCKRIFILPLMRLEHRCNDPHQRLMLASKSWFNACYTYEYTYCKECVNVNEENSFPAAFSFLPTRCLGYKTSLCEPTSCNDWQCGSN